jgi:hypothetical protein
MGERARKRVHEHYDISIAANRFQALQAECLAHSA